MSPRFFAGLLIFSLLTSCHKASDYAAQLTGQPSLADAASVNAYGIGNWTYPSAVKVGDTLALVGRLFASSGHTQIRIGDTSAPIVFYGPVTGLTNVEVVKVIITASMGVGPNRPVSITANGITIEAPALTIQQYATQHRTDTTLTVAQVQQWLPSNLSVFQAGNIPLVESSCVTADGHIYFGNPLGIYALSNGQVANALLQGASLQEGSTSFSIDQFLGFTATTDNQTLYFSATVLENSADTASNFIVRLCKMQPGKPSSVVTLNRTLVHKNLGATNETSYSYAGDVGSIKLAATELQTDASGNVYFLNIYPPQNTGFDTYASWYQKLIVAGQSSTQAATNAVGLNNICELATGGKVTSLCSTYNFNRPPMTTGFPAAYMTYIVDPAGNNLYVSTMSMTNYTPNALIQVNIQQRTPVTTLSYVNVPNLRFLSYDTSTATGAASSLQPTFTNAIGYIYPQSGNPLTGVLALPNGDLLSPSFGPSLAAINLQSTTFYAYAGTEQGLFNAPAAQVNTTGPAKWINFSNMWAQPYTNQYLFAGAFCGQDGQGNIYYFLGAADYSNGVVFYKMFRQK